MQYTQANAEQVGLKMWDFIMIQVNSSRNADATPLWVTKESICTPGTRLYLHPPPQNE